MSTAQELGRRAVKCARWRWMPGMLTVQWWDGEPHPYRCRRHWRGHVAIGQCTDGRPEDNAEFCLPDLTDSATVGCLLALVREAWGDCEAHVTPMGGYDGDFGWRCWCATETHSYHFRGETEAEALVAALEAAP